MKDKKYILYKGYWAKLYPDQDKWQGEVLNSSRTAVIGGNSEEDAEKTLQNGLEGFIKAFNEPGIKAKAKIITIKNLIAELALAMTDHNMPCVLKDGTPVTGVYIEDGLVILDVNDERRQEIKEMLEETV